MDFAKKLALGILSPLFIFLLFATAFDIGFVRTATHPDTIKQLVSESGIYDSIVPSILQRDSTIQTSVGTFSTSDPQIAQAVKQAIPTQAVKQQTEAAIDNIYQWLDGDITQPNFKIDFAAYSGSLADKLAGAAQQKAMSLPACSPAQSLAIARNGNYDIAGASCLPQGISPSALGGQVKQSLAASDYFKQAGISAGDIKTSGGGCTFGSQCPDIATQESVFQTGVAKQLPKQYQRAKKSPLILVVLTVLTGAGIVFLSSTWPKGLRHIGINLAVIGVTMLIFSWALNRAVSTKIVPKIKVDNAVLQQDIRSLATDLGQRIDKNYWFFGGLYTVLGAGSVAVAEVSRRKAKSALLGQGASDKTPLN